MEMRLAGYESLCLSLHSFVPLVLLDGIFGMKREEMGRTFLKVCFRLTADENKFKNDSGGPEF